MREYLENGNHRGYVYQNLFSDILEEIVSEYWWCTFIVEPQILGQSKRWTPDLKISTENTFTLEDLNLAIIECKSVGKNVSSPVYWTHMSRAYMELNDLRLKRENQAIRFYLLVNRSPVKGESPKLDYHQLVKSIDVELVHTNNPLELAIFTKKIHQLCESSNPVQQMKDIGPIELEKIPDEVLERTNEIIEKRNRELKLLLDRFQGDRR